MDLIAIAAPRSGELRREQPLVTKARFLRFPWLHLPTDQPQLLNPETSNIVQGKTDHVISPLNLTW